MAKKTLSIDGVGKQPINPYEDMATLTREEAFSVISGAAYERVLYTWGSSNHNPRLTIDDRVLGAVYSTLSLLQNGKEGHIPPFDLYAVLPLSGTGSEPVAYVPRDGKDTACLWPEDPLSLASNSVDPVSLTSAYCDVYDRYRDRLAACARDLFQD